MAKVEEGFLNRREEVGKTLEVPFFIFEAADEDAVKSACYADTDDGGLPKSIGIYLLDYFSIEERINDTTWRILARYKRPEWPQDPPPEGRFSFDTSGGTQHVTQSLQTVGRYGPKSTDKLQGAIGFDGRNVQGVDITVPVFNFTESHWFTPDKITQAYKVLLFLKTGKYNTDSFRGFYPGEVLFLGAAGDRQGDNPDDQWELSFRFAVMPNRSNFTIGSISVASKLGWEYLWVQYDDAADDDNKQIVKKPVAVYVERVYEGTLFSELGIG